MLVALHYLHTSCQFTRCLLQ